MLGRTLLIAFSIAIPACASSVQGGSGGDRVDGRPIDFVIDAALADARPGQDIDGGVTPSADAAMAVEATVTATCLFVRTGPGTENAKVPCTDTGIWCNLDDDVCIPMGETASVDGTSQAGTGCVMNWFPIEYRSYSGWGCGTFLEFPSSAAAALPSGHQTEYPSQLAGPQG